VLLLGLCHGRTVLRSNGRKLLHMLLLESRQGSSVLFDNSRQLLLVLPLGLRQRGSMLRIDSRQLLLVLCESSDVLRIGSCLMLAGERLPERGFKLLQGRLVLLLNLC
jgi:hypothetical protein